MSIAKMKHHDGVSRGMARGLAVAAALALMAPLGFAAADGDSKPNRDPAQRLSVSADDPNSAARLLDSASEGANLTADAIEAADKPAPESAAATPETAPEPLTAHEPETARELEQNPAELQAPKTLRQTVIAQPSAPSTQRKALEYVEAIKAEAVHFNGIQPGGSTRTELRDKWGSPKEMKKTGAIMRYTYSVDPFKQVVVSLQGERVSGIAIYLEKPLASRPLADQLRLDDCEPVIIADAKGKPLGEGYPEHGVMFAYSAGMGAGHVQQIVLEPIDAQAFLLRCEARIKKLPAHALADADYATQLDPKLPRAHVLRAQALEMLGRPGAAHQAAEEALQLEPKNRDYRFLAAGLGIEAGEHQAAARILQRLLTQQPLPPLVEALAYQLWGDCLSRSADSNFSQAIEHHQHAIRLAEPLAGDASPATCRAAKILLVEANLAVARDVALGQWAHKNQAALKWLTRAKTIAEDLTQNDEADDILLLRVYESAMVVLAAAPGKTPTAEWIAGLKRVGSAQIEAADEAAYRGAMRWRLGLALADALTIERSQGRAAEALAIGEEAAKLLADAEATIDSPDRDSRAGQLFYRLGALEAIERGNHRAAVSWYDKALPLIESKSALKAALGAEPGRQGDMLVSMAVSYWETGAKEQAVRLSQKGAKSIEDAVDAGTLPGTALAVPYSNLSSMLAQQGDPVLAGHYAELTARVERAAARGESMAARPLNVKAKTR